MLCTLGSRSLSTPLCRITVEIRCAIVIALPFPGDKGVNGCLCSSTGLRIIKGVGSTSWEIGLLAFTQG